MKQSKGTHRTRVELWHNHIAPEQEKVTVTLKPGLAFSPSRDIKKAMHTDVFADSTLAKHAVKAALPCNCDRCAMNGKDTH